jgi:hypothetical protein
MAASRADRRHRVEQERQRRATRQERARHEAALPWLTAAACAPGCSPVPLTRCPPAAV